MDAGREIFATALLPDRKLRWLAQQPLASLPPGRDGERRLMLWVFEDALKQRWAAWQLGRHHAVWLRSWHVFCRQLEQTDIGNSAS